MDGPKVAKSNAQRQREYRERKKKNDPHYLERERARVKRDRVPIAEESPARQKTIRERNRVNSTKYREKKKAEEKDKIPINLNFRKERNDKKVRKRRRSTQLKECQALVRELLEKNKKLTTRCCTLERRIHRTNKQAAAKNRGQLGSIDANTPKSRAFRFLQEMEISPKKPLLRKLIMAEIIETEALALKNICQKIASGNIIRKYRLQRYAQHQHRIQRKPIRRLAIKNEKSEKIRRAERLFLEREDNSRCLPGQSDVVTEGTSFVAKRVLTDYLSNLHMKFCAENPTMKISLTTFSRNKPKHIQLTKFISRNTCLCTQHTNMAMLLLAMKSAHINVTANPEQAAREISSAQMAVLLNNLDDDDDVQFQEWKRVVMTDGKKRTKVVEGKLPAREFQIKVQGKYENFIQHCARVRNQFQGLKDLKENLPVNHVLVQMDFSENFTPHRAD